MRKHRRAICTAFAFALPLAACGSSDQASSDNTIAVTTSTAPSASANEVAIQNYTFPAITAQPGATLTLVDRDDEPHTVTADDGSFKAGPFNSKEPGQLVVPTTAGSYAIHCEIHPTMHGTLVVGDPTATPAPTPAPALTPAPTPASTPASTPDPYGY